jgi:hypothetical protein
LFGQQHFGLSAVLSKGVCNVGQEVGCHHRVPGPAPKTHGIAAPKNLLGETQAGFEIVLTIVHDELTLAIHAVVVKCPARLPIDQRRTPSAWPRA